MNLHLRYTTLFVGLLLITSCRQTRNMQVNIMRPAEITIPKEIKKMAILNRSIPSNQAVIEGIVTGELPKQDKKLSQECIRGLNDLLLTSNRFEVQRIDSAWNSSDPTSLSFGAPLPWASIDSLCAQMQVDGLLVLEFFDTDFNIHNPASTATQAVTSVLNGGTSSITVTGTATSTSGFRVYYSSKHQIPYEDTYKYKKWWRTTANNAFEAVGKLVKRSEALVDVSYETGTEFARSIVPLFDWEPRVMYKGKNDPMRRGERQALAKDWEGALATWLSYYDQEQKYKKRAKAAHNIALSYEVLGKLEEAQKWAGTAYVDGGKKPMLAYTEILDGRVREQQLLEEQLKTFE
ncbi:MAG: DUF6340 family protein [Bacteroidota bacterium]